MVLLKFTFLLNIFGLWLHFFKIKTKILKIRTNTIDVKF